MSDLDDAIRAHLELKRLRGADPREVARLEREALGTASHRTAEPFAPDHQAQVHMLAEHVPEREANTPLGYPHFGGPVADVTAWRAHTDGGEETQEFSIAHAPAWIDDSADHAGGSQRAS